MKSIIVTNRFKRALKMVQKRGYALKKMGSIIDMLACGDDLPSRCRPHKLVGAYEGLWECHIEPDWLLIYEITENDVILINTGTHSDLFK